MRDGSCPASARARARRSTPRPSSPPPPERTTFHRQQGHPMTEIIRHRKHKIMHGAVEHNGVLYFGGHAANDLSKGMADQTREICAKLDAFLAELGSDKTRILAARIYLSD